MKNYVQLFEEFTDSPMPEYQQRKANWTEKRGDDPDYFKMSLMENEFSTSYMWIKYFGGAELLSSKHIMDHRDFMRALLDGRITVEEIDNATAGAHGQVGEIPWSKTLLAQKIILPYLEDASVVREGLMSDNETSVISKEAKDAIHALLKKHKGEKVPDGEVHDLADKFKIKTDEVESYIYGLAADAI